MAEILTAKHSSDGGHWYRKDGTPAYTIIGGNGVERPTTLRDARKENLVPSVTEILKCAHKPALENWKIDQAILSCFTLPRFDVETEASLLARIKKDAQEQARKAAERGTLIHAWVQGGFEGKYADGKSGMDGYEYYESASERLYVECGPTDWICEKPFATDRYGGKCDLHNDMYLIDIKTTTKDLADIRTWDEHDMQLAAYDSGLLNGKFPSDRKCGILDVHALTAESKVIWIPEEKLQRGWRKFNCLLDYWMADKCFGE